MKNHQKQTIHATGGGGGGGGGNTQAHGSPLSGAGSCFWTGSLWERVTVANELSTFVTPKFFFSKKEKQWLHDISLQYCLIVHAKRSEQVLRGAQTRGGACWQADTQAIVIPYLLEYSQPEPIISFLASKGGDYSREATISNIAHCESCSRYFVLLSQ